MKGIEKNGMDELEERLSKCVPIAKKILEILATEPLTLGIINDKNGKLLENVRKEYVSIAGKILQVMKDANMKYSDKDYVFQLAMQSFEQARERVTDSFAMNYDAMLKNYFGKDLLDVDMNDMDKKLREVLNVK